MVTVIASGIDKDYVEQYKNADFKYVFTSGDGTCLQIIHDNKLIALYNDWIYVKKENVFVENEILNKLKRVS